MSSKGYTVGTYIIKSRKRTLTCQCVLYVRSVKIDLFVVIEKVKKK